MACDMRDSLEFKKGRSKNPFVTDYDPPTYFRDPNNHAGRNLLMILINVHRDGASSKSQGGSRAKKYPKIDSKKQENSILLHSYIIILKSQRSQLTPLTF